MVNFINKEQARDKSYLLKVLQSVKLPFAVTDINDFEVLTGGSKSVAVMPRSNEFVPFYKISRNLAHKIMDYYNQISPNAVNKKEVDYMALSFIGQVLIDTQNKESFFANLMIDNFKN